jgi:putative SOS response-associated peptidase YedK
MCGRKFSHEELTWADYRDMLQIIQPPPDTNFQPNYNICPTQKQSVCLIENGQRVLHQMHWGLVPQWAKDTKFAAKMINARAETLTEKPSFRPLVQNNRCIIMVSGFYEWERQGRQKTPYKVERGDKSPMMLGGLWTHNNTLNITSYSVITTAAPPEFEHIHHRAPVIIDPDKISSWLDDDWSRARQNTQPYAGKLVTTEIGSAVNNIRNNGPELLEPAPSKLL